MFATKGLFNILMEGTICDQGAFQPRSWWKVCLRPRDFSPSILMKDLSATKGNFNLDLDKGNVFNRGAFKPWSWWKVLFVTSILTKELCVTKGPWSWWRKCQRPRSWWKNYQRPWSWWRNCLGPREFWTLILTEGTVCNLDLDEGIVYNLDLDEGNVCDQGNLEPRSW